MPPAGELRPAGTSIAFTHRPFSSLMTMQSARDAKSIPAGAVARRRSAGLSVKHREWIAGYLFIAPDFIGLALFVGGPMILALTMGFFSVDGFGAFTFVGLDNYK